MLKDTYMENHFIYRKKKRFCWTTSLSVVEAPWLGASFLYLRALMWLVVEPDGFLGFLTAQECRCSTNFPTFSRSERGPALDGFKIKRLSFSFGC